MLLKAGLSCAMKEEEECENTAIALERVVSDLIGLTTAVAKALNNALDQFDHDDDMDRDLVKKWCIFYSEELLPQTKKMVKSTSPTLDAYGLYLPSRMGSSVPQDLLQKGLKGAEIGGNDVESEDESCAANVSDDAQDRSEQMYEREAEQEDNFNGEVEVNENLYDEYEYDEYEYDEE